MLKSVFLPVINSSIPKLDGKKREVMVTQLALLHEKSLRGKRKENALLGGTRLK